MSERDLSRDGRNRGRFARIALVGGFLLCLLVAAVSLVVVFAPTPYLGVNHAVLATSIDSDSVRGCQPARGGWNCWKSENGNTARYYVTADWAGCWTGRLAGGRASADTPPKISGCVSIMDHLTAD